MSQYRSGWDKAIEMFMDAARWGILLSVLGSLVQIFSKFLLNGPTFESLFNIVGLLSFSATFIGFVYTVRRSGLMGIFGYPFALLGGEAAFIGVMNGDNVMFLVGSFLAFGGGWIIAQGIQFKRSR